MNSILKKFKAVILLCRLDKPFLTIPFVIVIACISANANLNFKMIIWILLAVVSGLMIGNSVNGLTDRKIDKLNPRTAQRPLAADMLSVKEVIILITMLLFIMLFSVYMISPFYILLLPIPGTLIVFYSFSKRFTWTCHMILGVIEAAIPFSTWGILNSWTDPRAVLSGAVVFFWIVGFECIYSIQDIEYDKKTNMKSIPSEFGIKFSLQAAHICHVIMIILCCTLAYFCKTGLIFYIGIFIASVIILYEHIIVANDKKNASRSFNISEFVCLILMAASVLDFIVRRYI